MAIKEKNIHTEKIPRRGFLKTLWIAIAGISVLEVSAVIVAFLTSGSRRNSRPLSAGMKTLGNADDFSNGSVTAFRSDRLYLVRTEDGGFLAFSLHCTHLGCAVSWNDTAGVFECPCHASSFNRHGDVIAPPASRALDRIPLKIEGGMVKADIGKPQRRKHFDASQLTYI